MNRNSNSTKRPAFTLIEMIVVLTMIGFALSILVPAMNWTDRTADNLKVELRSTMQAVEMAAGAYYADRGVWPTGLADATFVPTYTFAPRVPKGFDSAYQVGGWWLRSWTGSPTQGKGLGLSLRHWSNVTADHAAYKAAVALRNELPAGKITINTFSGAKDDMPTPAGASALYITYWITRTE